MNIPQDAISLIEKSPLSGMSCSFIKVDDKWGIKAYEDEGARDDAFGNQVEYAKLDFAPPAGECFMVGDYYCYSTRVAEILLSPEAPMREWQMGEREYSQQILCKIGEMGGVGLYPSDFHIANWGIYEGKLMLIDLGMG